MAEDVVEPSGAQDEAGDAPVQDTDVSDLPLDESPEAHIRRAMAGEDPGGGAGGAEGDAGDAEGDAGDAGDAGEPAEASGE